ncbi:MAG: MarR family transcriptional regulator [Actinomycetota bacterium]
MVSPDAVDVLRTTAALLRAQTTVGAAIERAAVDPSGLDATTSDLLLRLGLSPTGSLRPAELCRQMQLSASHISRRVDRAIDEGLVERRPDPADRRAQLVSLTVVGEAALDRFLPRLIGVVDAIVTDTFDTDEIALIVELLDRLEHAARSTLDEMS